MIQYAQLLTFREAFYLTEAGEEYLANKKRLQENPEMKQMELIEGKWQLSNYQKPPWWDKDEYVVSYDMSFTTIIQI